MNNYRYQECTDLLKFAYDNNIDIKITYSLINKQTNDYKHPIVNGVFVFRIDIDKDKRFFVWMISIIDTIIINKFVCNKLKKECHEIFVTPNIKLFIDFDLCLKEEDLTNLVEYLDLQNELYPEIINNNIVSFLVEYLSDKIQTSLKINKDNYDYMYCSRNRLNKISFHLVTNIVSTIANIKLDINKIIKEIEQDSEIDQEIKTIILDSIDLQPYHRNGSLSLPLGVKKFEHGFASNIIKKDWTYKDQTYLLTSIDPNNIVLYENMQNTSSYNSKSLDLNEVPNEMKIIINNLHSLNSFEDMSAFTTDGCKYHIESKSILLRRIKSSHCNICDKTHDRDNTLLIREYNSLGFYKCKKSTTKSTLFYKPTYEKMNGSKYTKKVKQISSGYSLDDSYDD